MGFAPSDGRPPYDPVTMFKVLVLASMHNLSDEGMEFLIRDRLSWLRFLGFEIGEPTPDQKTIWLFREKLTQEKLTQEKLTQEKLTQEKLTQEKLTQEKLTQEKLTQEKLTQEKLTQEKLTQGKADPGKADPVWCFQISVCRF